jgi:hypothetical protein
MVEGGHNAARYSMMLGLAGRVCLFCTDSPRLMELASEFFSPCPAEKAQRPRAAITLLVRSRRGASSIASDHPVFRGRNEFVHADYGRDGSVWFDLKSREVAGVLSDEIIADEGFSRRAILAVIAGVLAPSLGVIALHAGCVVRDGRAILLAAPSGTGKSTISLALALRGWSLLSDDWTFVSDAQSGLGVWGMQTSIKLLPDARVYFPELSALSPALSLNGELSFEFDPWSFFGVRRSIDAAPTAVVLLKRASAKSNEHGCYVSHSCQEETMEALLEEMEEQPEAIADEADNRASTMQQLCSLPSLHVRFSGEPAAVAADLDGIFTELICA